MKQNQILKWSLILSIAIVANLFFNYALSLTLNNPHYDEYCSLDKITQIVEDKETCDKEDGIWNQASKSEIGMKDAPVGYCDLNSKCNNRYEEKREVYEQKVFVALIVIGVAVLITSFALASTPVLASALALTAVLNFVIASMRYWGYADELLKVGILFIALITLNYVTIKKFKDKV